MLFAAVLFESGDRSGRLPRQLEGLDLAGVEARIMLDEEAPWESTAAPAHVLVGGGSR